MFYEVLVFGTFWFWAFVALELSWIIYCFALECRAWRFIASIVAFLGILQCFSNVNVFMTVVEHPLLILSVFVAYMIGGGLWVFPKWWFFCKEHLRKYLDLREQFQLENKLPVTDGIAEEYKAAWVVYYKNNNRYDEDRIVFKPEPGRYKDRIITWMTLWPLSFFWTMLNDPIVRLFRHFYYEISGILRRISDNVFKDVKDFDADNKTDNKWKEI